MIELEKPQGAAADEIGLLGRLTETGWVPPRTMSFPECGAELRAIRRCHHGVLFGIGDVLNYAERKWGETYAQLASDSGYNAQFLMNCKWVAAKFPVHDRVPGLSFSHHQVVAGLPLEQARALLVIAGAEEWSKDYLRRRIKQLRSPRAVESGVESHSGIRIGGSCLIDSLGDEQVVGRAKQIRSLPKLYDVLYADPPWRDENRFLDSMPTAGICALPVEDIAGDDAMLFLWARPGMLADALQVIKAWGFHYAGELVWVKDKIRIGDLFSNQHEILLYARRGECPLPEQKLRRSSVLEARRGKHSEKPDEIFRILDRYYPDSAGKIELFQRESAEPPKGWAIWGRPEPADALDVKGNSRFDRTGDRNDR